MNSLKVVLNAHAFSVPELINQSRLWVQRVTDNATLLPSCAAIAAKITIAANELEIADEAATDGGKTKTREKHDKYNKLMALLPVLAHQVELDAGGDESIVHLAGMEVQRKGSRSTPEFSASQSEGQGSVTLRTKARSKTIYRWQYATDPALASWIDAGISRGCKKVISHLSSGIYWFRVVFIDDAGEHNGEVLKVAVA
jgi:hypothetical protein